MKRYIKEIIVLSILSIIVLAILVGGLWAWIFGLSIGSGRLASVALVLGFGGLCISLLCPAMLVEAWMTLIAGIKNKDKYYMEKIKIFPKSEHPLLRNCVLVLIAGILLFSALTVYDNREAVFELFSDENRIIKVEHDQIPGRIVSITSKERLLPTRIWVDDITVTVSVDLPNGGSTYKTYSATCNRLGTGGFRSLSVGQQVYVGYTTTIYADGHKDYELGNLSY